MHLETERTSTVFVVIIETVYIAINIIHRFTTPLDEFMTEYFLRVKGSLYSDCIVPCSIFLKLDEKYCGVSLLWILPWRKTGSKPCLPVFCPTRLFPIYSPCDRTKLFQIYMITVQHFHFLGCIKNCGPSKLCPFKFDDNDSVTIIRFYNFMPTRILSKALALAHRGDYA